VADDMNIETLMLFVERVLSMYNFSSKSYCNKIENLCNFGSNPECRPGISFYLVHVWSNKLVSCWLAEQAGALLPTI
jgi:hypothetical protein